jgi:hypothetical protein
VVLLLLLEVVVVVVVVEKVTVFGLYSTNSKKEGKAIPVKGRGGSHIF